MTRTRRSERAVKRRGVRVEKARDCITVKIYALKVHEKSGIVEKHGGDTHSKGIAENSSCRWDELH